MNHLNLINALERFGNALPAVVTNLSDEDARWRPSDPPGMHWSILEIITHLADEEVEDFRTRLRLTIESPERDWPKIDPQAWAQERSYNEGDLDETISRFVRERRESVRWLREIPQDIDWSQAHPHPRVGPVAAGVLLASWAAHDALHLRQIAKRMFQLANRDAEGYTTIYAGEW